MYNLRNRRFSIMYGKIIEKCMKYVTDSNGNISEEKLQTNSKKIMGIGWISLLAGVLLFGLGLLSLYGGIFWGKAITFATIMFFVLLMVATILLAVGPALLQAGYTFKIASQCLKDNIEVIRCPFCGNILDDDHNYCGKCGSKFKIQTTCEHCATVNNHGAKFCKTCGSLLASKIGTNNSNRKTNANTPQLADSKREEIK